MLIEPPHESIDIPEVDIWSFLFELDHPYPNDKVLFSDANTGQTYTWPQLREAAVAFGGGLQHEWKWRKGDVLAIFSPNDADIGPVVWGCHWAGGVVTTVNPAYTLDELVLQLKDARAKAIVTQKAQLPTALLAAQKVGLPADRVILLGSEPAPSASQKHFRQILSLNPGSSQRVRSQPNDLAFLVYSSGTTGMPKGVMLSHKNIISNVLQTERGEGGHVSWNGNADGTGDRLLGILPFFHIYAPPVLVLFAKDPLIDQYDLSSLRMLQSGAAPLDKQLVEDVWARLKVPVKQGYGLSETSPSCLMLSWERWRDGAGSVGHLVVNMQARLTEVVDEALALEKSSGIGPVGAEVTQPEDVGELWLRGPNVFQGYWNNEAGTRQCLTRDGWFRTGDVGYMGKDGLFYITDRAKELIKYKGYQVAPAELEGILLGCPLVADVAVIGVHDVVPGTEVPRAHVVLHPDAKQLSDKQLSEKHSDNKDSSDQNSDYANQIMDYLHARVAPHKRLRGGLVFVDAIPKSPSGKILRRMLREKQGPARPKARL